MKLKLEVEFCETIGDACDYAQAVADKVDDPVEFQFNSVLCVAVPGGCAVTLKNRQFEASQMKPRVTSA